MSDSLDLNVSPASPETPKRRVARTKKRPHSRRPALPDWAPWAVLGGLIVVGAVGSRVVQAAVASSEAPKASDAANTGATAAPPAASNALVRIAEAASAQAAREDESKMSALHLVVTHGDSVMGKALHITRTRAQAKQRASEALARARKGEDFAKLIGEYTEEPHTDQTHGELKNFRRKDAMPSFADAAFKLKVGEVSDVVDTPYGYMVILRTK
jgi:hypothetical protein